MNNLELSQAILSDCWRAGVREILICAGARNAPVVKVLAEDSPFKMYSFFEERSAGFFALGRMQATGRPVAVVTTSGTAAAELLPACIEADYQHLPLVMITADRPRRYRGSGSPQTIQQPGIYSHYVGHSLDVEGEWNALPALARRPLHINVCFDEPLLNGTIQPWNLADQEMIPAKVPSSPAVDFAGIKAPLVIVGGLTSAEAARVLPILQQWQRPLYLEGPSRLRGHKDLEKWEIRGSEKSLQHIDYDGVIRIGSVPTLRYWRDLEAATTPVICFASSAWTGLSRVKQVFALESLSAQNFTPWTGSARDQEYRQRRDQLFKEFPLSEPAWVHWLSLQMQGRLFVGNSLPIREWDFAADFQASTRDIFANRGTNGIDGLISTFAGVAREKAANWAMIGDLSALYDLSGPWALRQRPLEQFNLVIINNAGGQIFQHLFRNPMFLNAHDLHFGDWAKMWNLQYQKLESPPPFLVSGRQVIEVIPSATQTADFWRAWESL